MLVADETWIATALLHREHPDRPDFTVREIVDRAAAEGLVKPVRPGIQVHAHVHAVANRPPSPAALRMLFATVKNRRRLYRDGDETHPKRAGKTVPRRDAIPPEYHYLLDWYREEYNVANERWLSGLFDLVGTGRALFEGVDPDQYVRNLREGWD